MPMENLANIVRKAMSTYATEGENGYSYLTQTLDGDVFTVVYVSQQRGKTEIDTGLLVRIVNGRIIVLRDQNNKPLVDALLQAGVPREQIVLAYAGESVEETA
jgi:hypothetical protein